MENPFIRSEDDYHRDIDPIGQYQEQAAMYLSVQTGKSLDECKTIVKSLLKDRDAFPSIKNPQITYLRRKDYADRQEEKNGLMQYIQETLHNKEILAPTFTVYEDPHVEESVYASYMDYNKSLRKKDKKDKFKAESEGNTFMYNYKDSAQGLRKTKMNSCSGGFGSAGTCLSNKSAHPTLTTGCRTASGYGNANNEKIIAGNRHYYHPDIVVNNITSTVTYADYDLLHKVMVRYNLHYPTAQETLEVIEYSSRLYWENSLVSKNILTYLEKLTPIQRAAFVYLGDFYHVRKFNEDFVRDFLDRLSQKHTELLRPVQDVVKAIHDTNEAIVIHAHLVCKSITKGAGKNYAKWSEENRTTLLATCQGIENVLNDDKDFIRCIFTPPLPPASVAYLPTIVRRTAFTSDTDSTIFSVQNWVLWRFGKINYQESGYAFASSVIFLSTQSITNILASVSANFGIAKERTFDIAMKYEFFFDVFATTNLTKHYYASIAAQEGNVFDKPKYEIKGVHLKNSNLPVVITQEAEEIIKEITETIKSEKKIKIIPLLKRIAWREREIASSIQKGENKYLRYATINDKNSYKLEEDKSPYAKHKFWNEVFGPSYTLMPDPPYQCLKVSLDIPNKTVFKDFLDSIADTNLKQRMIDWLSARGKSHITNVWIPQDIIVLHGMPKELIPWINTRKTVAELCHIYYLILETLGFYFMNGKVTKLLSDIYKDE